MKKESVWWEQLNSKVFCKPLPMDCFGLWYSPWTVVGNGVYYWQAYRLEYIGQPLPLELLKTCMGLKP